MSEKDRVHWSEGTAKAEGRHEIFVASKEGVVWPSGTAAVSEPKGKENSEDLKSDKSV